MANHQIRYIRVVADTLDVSELDVSFSAKYDLTKNSNSMELKVYNLSAEHRNQLSDKASRNGSLGVTVELHAGYEKDGVITESLIFLGRLRKVSHAKINQNTYETTIGSGTGDELSNMAQFSARAGASVYDVVSGLLGQVGMAINDSSIAQALNIKVGPGGESAYGTARDELDRLLKENGLTYSVQNGDLQILGPNQTTNQTLLVLSQQSGMVGSPEITSTVVVADEDKKTRKTQRTIKVTHFLNPEIRPGRQIEVKSSVLGTETEHVYFRVQEVENAGSTFSQDWYTTLEAKEIIV